MIVLHMVEEEHFPGGFGYMFNVIVFKSDVPDRYPMSPFIAMVVDVVIFFILFVPAFFFPEVIWLGMAPMLLAIMELGTHGGIGIYQWRRRNLSIYNPGLATAVVLAGIGIMYTIIASSGGLLKGIDWLWAVLYFVGAMLLGLMLPERGLRSKSTPWAWDKKHLLGYYKRYITTEELVGSAAHS
jgi:hypothetical protein